LSNLRPSDKANRLLIGDGTECLADAEKIMLASSKSSHWNLDSTITTVSTAILYDLATFAGLVGEKAIFSNLLSRRWFVEQGDGAQQARKCCCYDW